MDTFEAIRQRRAIKAYDPNFQIPAEDLEKILDIASYAPSSFNIQHWRLVNVTDPDLRQKIRAAAHDQAQVTDASVLFVVATDIKAWEKNMQYKWRNAPQAVADYIVPATHSFYNGREQVQRDEAMRSVGFIAQTIMLAATDLGYQSCPMIGFDSDKVGELINLPADHAIGMLLVIGKGTKAPWPKSGFIDRSEMVIENGF